MNTILTRSQVIALGEKVIATVIDPNAYVSFGDIGNRILTGSEPEIEAFRQVLREGSSFAVSATQRNSCRCPMAQTVFGIDTTVVDLDASTSDQLVWRIAFAWDDIVEEDYDRTDVVLVAS